MSFLSGAMSLGRAATAVKWIAILAVAGSVYGIYNSFASGQAAKGELRVMREIGTENVRQLHVAREAAKTAQTRADAALADGQAAVQKIEQLEDQEGAQCGCSLDSELPESWFQQ